MRVWFWCTPKSQAAAQSSVGLKLWTVRALQPLLDHDYCYAAFLVSQKPVLHVALAVQEMYKINKILCKILPLEATIICQVWQGRGRQRNKHPREKNAKGSRC